mgnify:FL=1
MIAGRYLLGGGRGGAVVVLGVVVDAGEGDVDDPAEVVGHQQRYGHDSEKLRGGEDAEGALVHPHRVRTHLPLVFPAGWCARGHAAELRSLRFDERA